MSSYLRSGAKIACAKVIRVQRACLVGLGCGQVQVFRQFALWFWVLISSKETFVDCGILSRELVCGNVSQSSKCWAIAMHDVCKCLRNQSILYWYARRTFRFLVDFLLLTLKSNRMNSATSFLSLIYILFVAGTLRNPRRNLWNYNSLSSSFRVITMDGQSVWCHGSHRPKQSFCSRDNSS